MSQWWSVFFYRSGGPPDDCAWTMYVHIHLIHRSHRPASNKLKNIREIRILVNSSAADIILHRNDDSCVWNIAIDPPIP